jgi:hypothetical protein
MIFENIQFHNVEELERTERGLIMWRVPAQLRQSLNQVAAESSSRYSTGVELRFEIVGDSAAVILRADPMAEAQVAYIYYGSFQGGWQYSSKVIGDKDTRIEIPYPHNINELRILTEKYSLPFQPEIVRIVLPYGNCYFVGVEGDVRPQRPEQLPGRTYLAYGSSITHGSLSLAAPCSYPFGVARALGCDYLNLGFAGSAHLEPEMARYIVGRSDWDFASFELGINMIGDNFSESEFDARVSNFIDIIAGDSRPIFVTSLFGFCFQNQDKARRYREIVRKYAESRLVFTDGLELLSREDHISQDMIHPSVEGINEIATNWLNIMREHLNND